MRNYLLLISVACFALACNKQDDDIPTISSAEFTVSKTLFYAIEPLTIRAVYTTGKSSYTFDFGDGTRVTGGYNTTHQYNNGGNFTITLSVDDKTYTKQIRVLPGSLSYQVKNSSTKSFDALTYVGNYTNGTLYRAFYTPGKISDTLYGTNLQVTGPNFLHILGASVFFGNREYVINQQSNALVAGRQHHILEIKDSTLVSPRSNAGPVPPVYYLKDL